MRCLVLPAAVSLLCIIACTPAVAPERARPEIHDAANAKKQGQAPDVAPHSENRRLKMLLQRTGYHVAIVWSPDSKTLASASGEPAIGNRRLGDQSVKLWELTSGRNTVTLPASVWAADTYLAWSRDGKTLASCAPRGGGMIGRSRSELRCWDVPSYEEIGESQSTQGERISGLAFTADGTKLILANGKDRRTGDFDDVTLLDLATRKERRLGNPVPNGIDCMAVSSDETVIAVGTRNSIQIWSYPAGELKGTLQLVVPNGGDVAPRCVEFSKDSRTLATGLSNGRIIIWNVATLRQIAAINAYEDQSGAVDFHPDRPVLASGGPQGLKLWNLPAGDQIDFPGGAGRVSAVRFSPDGNWLASGGTEGALTVWDVSKIGIDQK